MNSNGYARIVLGVFTCLFSSLLHAEPVLVLGGFINESNAATHLRRVEARLNDQGVLSQISLKGAPFYRVIVPIKGRPIEPLKQRARDAGFEGVWTWETDLALSLIHI